MTVKEAENTLKSMVEQCGSDSDLLELYDCLVQCAVRYAQSRVEWFLANSDNRMAIDEIRTRAHDSFVDSCNALSRLMGEKDRDNNWRREIGQTRGEIGDFACHIHAALGLRAR